MMKKRIFSVEEMSKKSINNLMEFSKMNLKNVYRKLNTDVEGLAINQVEKSREKWGLNRVENEKPISWYIQLIKAFSTSKIKNNKITSK
ncbi:cation-transporting P-type ATPase [Clostridium sporogenes]|uniref:cation-transporting P-type ATPase n=2 Tax=Clostridium sporogenes TaxID=1509 RepID=UPI003F91199C